MTQEDWADAYFVATVGEASGCRWTVEQARALLDRRVPPRFTDDQLECFYTTTDGKCHGVTPMGLGSELTCEGLVEMRRIWVEYPEKRGLFDEVPPEVSYG